MVGCAVRKIKILQKLIFWRGNETPTANEIRSASVSDMLLLFLCFCMCLLSLPLSLSLAHCLICCVRIYVHMLVRAQKQRRVGISGSVCVSVSG